MEKPVENLNLLLSTPGDQPVQGEIVEQLTERWPAFVFPEALALRHPHPDLNDDDVARLIQHIAMSIPDPRRVRLLIDPEGTGKYDNFYPTSQVAKTPTTPDAIDTFLSTYGNIDPAEEALLQRMIFNPVPDYAAQLESEAGELPAEPLDEQDRLMAAFIEKPHAPAVGNEAEVEVEMQEVQTPAADSAPAKVTPTTTPRPAAGSLLSESLAKIFIKQHNYKRAYEIISSLSLNYPEKSIYFADQLRFLAKLIANQEAFERINNKK